MGFNKKNINLTKSGFRYKCLFVLVDGYNAMKNTNKYSVDWEEENLTAQLIHYSEESSVCKKWKIHLFPEKRLYTKEIIFGEKKANTAARIDIKMTAWLNKEKDIFHVESKNLCEKDWIKENGAKVNSSYLLNRYVNKGVKHFMSNHYPSNSCMCGYILNGNTEKTIEKIDEILEKKSLNKLKISKPVNNHKLIYTIEYNQNNLINLFFDFARQ